MQSISNAEASPRRYRTTPPFTVAISYEGEVAAMRLLDCRLGVRVCVLRVYGAADANRARVCVLRADGTWQADGAR
eukprot:1123786-Prymnesium_polylepis.1